MGRKFKTTKLNISLRFYEIRTENNLTKYILCLVLCILREERRLRVFENRVLRRVFGPKRDEVTGEGENYIMRSLGICTPYPILCGW